jgi:succinate dehydrogenase hydrophobic anchor subunit
MSIKLLHNPNFHWWSQKITPLIFVPLFLFGTNLYLLIPAIISFLLHIYQGIEGIMMDYIHTKKTIKICNFFLKIFLLFIIKIIIIHLIWLN